MKTHNSTVHATVTFTKWIVDVAAVSMACIVIHAMSWNAAAQDSPHNPMERVDVLIGFKIKPGAAEQEMVRAAGGKIKHSYTLVPAIAANLPQAALTALQNNPTIDYIEPDDQLYEAAQQIPWGVEHVGALDVHLEGNTGAGVKIAILDSGIDYDHPEFNPSNIEGYSFAGYTDDYWDDHGHGTAVAGIIAARDNTQGVIGIAPGATIVAVKVHSAMGYGSTSDVIAALEWIYEYNFDNPNDKIRITNSSFGKACGDYVIASTLQAAYDNLYYSGVLNIAAAGNSGNKQGTGNNVWCPAGYDRVVAVAAIKPDNKRTTNSSTGPAVELSAPGQNILTTVPGTESNEEGRLGYFSGTTVAAAHVTGVAALVWAENPDLTNEEVREILQLTAIDLGAPGPDPDPQYGFGLVDAEAAVAMAATYPINTPPVVSITVPDLDSLSQRFFVTTTEGEDVVPFIAGAALPLAGIASDNGFDLSDSLDWTITRNIDDYNETHENVSSIPWTIPSDEVDVVYTITAEVTHNGVTGSASISIPVSTPLSPYYLGCFTTHVDLDKDAIPPAEYPIYKQNQTVTVNIESSSALYLRYANGDLIDPFTLDPSHEYYIGPINGAEAHFILTNANGYTTTTIGTTGIIDGISGRATFNYKVNPKKDGYGIYKVIGSVWKEGYRGGLNVAYFEVKK